MDSADKVGARQRQRVVVAGQIARVSTEALASEVSLRQAQPLQLRTHRSIENQDAFAEQRLEEGPRSHVTLNQRRPEIAKAVCCAIDVTHVFKVAPVVRTQAGITLSTVGVEAPARRGARSALVSS
jgi:hypothetical protein